MTVDIYIYIYIFYYFIAVMGQNNLTEPSDQAGVDLEALSNGPSVIRARTAEDHVLNLSTLSI